ncbi:hypothetical protein DFJ77DRAFT_174831 [Powellomyces hirtus]|nr:hypothetical protein DFJ77DRAFT_174831 [Powellomyces hirtus]
MPSRTDDTLHVHIPGVILALLQHEMLNAVLQNNVEGILFGTRETRLKAQTTDHSSDETHSATTVLISSYVCMDPSRRYYNQRGEIIPERLAELTRGKEDSVVGMFKWRRNSKLALAIREEAVYKSLQYHQSASGQENAQVIGIFTASNDDPALFQFDFAFYNQQGESSPCGKVPTVVANLVESAQIQHEWFVPATPSFAQIIMIVLTIL